MRKLLRGERGSFIIELGIMTVGLLAIISAMARTFAAIGDHVENITIALIGGVALIAASWIQASRVSRKIDSTTEPQILEWISAKLNENTRETMEAREDAHRLELKIDQAIEIQENLAVKLDTAVVTLDDHVTESSALAAEVTDRLASLEGDQHAGPGED